MTSLILFAALLTDPETLLLRAEVELLRAKIAVLESSEPSPAVVTPQPPAATDPSGPGVQTLRERIAAYRDSGGQPWYVSGMTDAQHLVNDHGWSASELRGLTVAELQLLHGASHTGRIQPGTVKQSLTVADAEIVVYSPASFQCPACNAWKSVTIPGVEIKHVRKDWSGWRSYPVVKVNGRHYYSPTIEQVKAMLR